MAVRQSDKGRLAVGHTIAATKDVASLYQSLLHTMEQLKLKNNRLLRVIELLSSIAAETHLLALNAAIEAVAAGEYGERFRVVAQKVKKSKKIGGKF